LNTQSSKKKAFCIGGARARKVQRASSHCRKTQNMNVSRVRIVLGKTLLELQKKGKIRYWGEEKARGDLRAIPIVWGKKWPFEGGTEKCSKDAAENPPTNYTNSEDRGT